MVAKTGKKGGQAPRQQMQVVIIGGAIFVAILTALVAIYLSNQNTAAKSDIDFSELEQHRLSDGGYVLGNPDAPITIVEFADFLCPHCQAYKPEVNDIMKELVVTGEARFEFRMLPTQGPQSQTLFEVAECIGMNGGSFWDAHEEIFAAATDGGVDRDDIARTVANRMDLNYAEIFECTTDLDDSGDAQWIIDNRLGGSAEVSGTPAVRIRVGDMEAPLQTVSGYSRGGVPLSALRDAVEAASIIGS